MSEEFYIVKQTDGRCLIATTSELADQTTTAPQSNGDNEPQRWGPFATEGEAIARRVGLIRSGKCLPT